MFCRLLFVATLLLASLLPSAASAAVTELQVPVGHSVSDQRNFTLTNKTTYTITVTGTVQWRYGGNGATYDAAYRKDGSDGALTSWQRDGTGLTLTAPPGTTGAGQGVAEKHGAFHPYPEYRDDHTYTFTYTHNSETSEYAFWAHPQGQTSQPNAEFSGSFNVRIEYADAPAQQPPPGQRPPPGCAATARARAAQASCPRPGPKVSRIKGKVEIQRGGAGWEPLKDGDTLQDGDRVHTGWRSDVTVTLPDGSTVTIKPMSLIGVDKAYTDGGGGRFLLRLGEVKAQIHKIGGSSGDFVVKTPTTTASVRGTAFSVRYDRGLTVVGVTEGTVAVAPVSGRAVDVNAGQEVASTRSAVSPPVAIGQAGAPRGSVGPARAAALLTSRLARGFAACRVDVARTTSSFALQAIAGGWRATLSIVGRRKGRAVWTIAGTRISPRNALARRISRRCR